MRSSPAVSPDTKDTESVVLTGRLDLTVTDSVVSPGRLDPKGAEEGVFPALPVLVADQANVGHHGQCVVVFQQEDALKEGHVIRVGEHLGRFQ